MHCLVSIKSDIQALLAAEVAQTVLKDIVIGTTISAVTHTMAKRDPVEVTFIVAWRRNQRFYRPSRASNPHNGKAWPSGGYVHCCMVEKPTILSIARHFHHWFQSLIFDLHHLDLRQTNSHRKHQAEKMEPCHASFSCPVWAVALTENKV